MKYSESSSRSRFTGSAAFYIIIACCLIAIGGASWFAVSNYNRDDNQPPVSSGQDSNGLNGSGRNGSGDINNSSNNNSNNNSGYNNSSKAYPDNSSSYNGSVQSPGNTSAIVGETVKDEPYAKSFTMPVQGEVIKNHSVNADQYSATFLDYRPHTGIDIACEDGTAVSACGNGKVVSIEQSSSLGNVITIDHGNSIVIKYANIKDSKVKANDKVKVGDIIGTVTSVPNEVSDQSHLHLEVYKNGHATSPLEALGLS